ncbi:hypothetical protein EDB85DRAFT_1945973 [Lactarius pseudohatsudake]|nr:hypothetical protein EDB85DRAFT_1945973 [Lactarius pseudohatsudake]
MSRLLSDFCHFDFGVPFPTLPNMKCVVPDSISTSSIISCRPSPRLTSLPDDVLLLVISLVGVEDILALRMTSKRFSSVTKQRWVWSDVLKHQVINRRLPVPAFITDLKSLSAKELEARAIHASRFHRNWSSSHPHSRRSVEFRAREPTAEEVSSLQLADADPHPISQVEQCRVACWEVPFEGSEAFLVAERSLPDCVIDGLVVNDDSDNEGMLIVMYSRIVGTLPLYEIKADVWSLDKFHGSFTTLRSQVLARNVQRRMSPVARLCGNLALLGDPVVLWNWKRKGPFFTMSSGNIHQSPTPDSVLAVRLVRNHLLVVRQSHIQLLPTPQFDQFGRPVQGASTFGAFLHVQDPAREAVVIVHEMTEEEREAWQFNPVTILMRVTTDEGHTIRKYDLLPRPVTSAEEQQNTTDSPCTLPARPAQTIQVPPSCSNLVVGRNGKGFWMETQNLTCGHSTFPVRSFIGFDTTSRLVPAQDQQPARWQNDLVVRENGMYKARVGAGEVHERKYKILTSSIEDTDGRVQILDFA